MIDGAYGLKRIEFRTYYFLERMGQVLYPVWLLSLVQYRVCIATEKSINRIFTSAQMLV